MTQDATDTIDYVAADQNGLSATSTRTVIIEAPQSPSLSFSVILCPTATTPSVLDREINSTRAIVL